MAKAAQGPGSLLISRFWPYPPAPVPAPRLTSFSPSTQLRPSRPPSPAGAPGPSFLLAVLPFPDDPPLPRAKVLAGPGAAALGGVWEQGAECQAQRTLTLSLASGVGLGSLLALTPCNDPDPKVSERAPTDPQTRKKPQVWREGEN